MDQVELAEQVATIAHKGQFRTFGVDKGKQYIVHPSRVADEITRRFCDWKDGQVIAWLHDVVEDTHVSLSDLVYKGFSESVVDGVSIMTRDPEMDYLDYILKIKASKYVIPIKIADIQDNLKSLKKGSLRDKYMLALYIL